MDGNGSSIKVNEFREWARENSKEIGFIPALLDYILDKWWEYHCQNCQIHWYVSMPFDTFMSRVAQNHSIEKSHDKVKRFKLVKRQLRQIHWNGRILIELFRLIIKSMVMLLFLMRLSQFGLNSISFEWYIE